MGRFYKLGTVYFKMTPMKSIRCLVFLTLLPFFISAQSFTPDNILYGVAYYHEYMPYDRLDTDVQMMKEAGVSVTSIAEGKSLKIRPWDVLIIEEK